MQSCDILDVYGRTYTSKRTYTLHIAHAKNTIIVFETYLTAAINNILVVESVRA